MIIDEIMVHLNKATTLLNKLRHQAGENSSEKVLNMDNPDFITLKSLLENENWSYAVNPDSIHDENSENDKKVRAENILDLSYPNSIVGKKMLDFGCGEGNVVSLAASMGASLAVGYDIVDGWRSRQQGENFVLTTNFSVVENNKYDFILVYDVLDHSFEEPVDILKKLRALLAENGIMFIRFHPFCSPHATHLYRQLNKAYLHLVFNSTELKALGLAGTYCREVLHPLTTYRGWLAEAGLKIINENYEQKAVESFFSSREQVANRIKNNWKASHEAELASGEVFPQFQLSFQFVDMHCC